MLQNLEIFHGQAALEQIAKTWHTKAFKRAFDEQPLFQLFKEKIKEAPIAFFTPHANVQRNHLTSHFRLIARRSYENKHIQDLYYLHELSHLVHYNSQPNSNYYEWSQKLSENELYASLVSEAFIYFFLPHLDGKTFNPLWTHHFLSNNYSAHKHFPAATNSDISKIDYLISNPNEMLNLEHDQWPSLFQLIIERRRQLRSLKTAGTLLPGEDSIIAYNQKRDAWLPRWKEQWKDIDAFLTEQKNNPNPLEFRLILKSKTDHRGICFPLCR